LVSRREKRKVMSGKRKPPKKAGDKRHKPTGMGREKRKISSLSLKRKAPLPCFKGKTPLGWKGRG